ncbi:MAG: hypothetical protein ACLGHY_04000, partial [Gammaproteobacteria bacterium]
RVRLRVRPCTTSQVIARLPEGVRCTDRTAEALVLRVPPLGKMTLVRVLAELGDIIEDIEMATPGLEELYRHLVEARGEAA